MYQKEPSDSQSAQYNHQNQPSLVIASGGDTNNHTPKSEQQPKRQRNKIYNKIKDVVCGENGGEKSSGWCTNKPRYMRISYYRNNQSFFVICFGYIFVQICLVCIQYYLYRNSVVAMKIARMAGILLKFNSCLIIVLVLRKSISWLRSTPIGKNLPLDDTVMFHKFIGSFIFVLTIVHATGHAIHLCKQ